jgi:hypothetical protein
MLAFLIGGAFLKHETVEMLQYDEDEQIKKIEIQ